MNPFSESISKMFDLRENDMHYTSKHRLLGTKGSLLGADPLKPLK